MHISRFGLAAVYALGMVFSAATHVQAQAPSWASAEQIAAAKSQHAEEDAGLGLVLDEFFQLFGGADAHIEVTIRAEDDAVHAAFDETGHGLLIRQLDTSAAMRAATGAEAINGGEDLGLLLAVGGW